MGLRPHLVAAISLVLMVVGLYWPTVDYDFVNWDDPWYVVNNDMIKSWHPANLWDVATKVAIRNYAPVTLFSYLVEHSLWGLWPGGYHTTNFLFHALNAVLVYFFIGRLTGSRFVGWTTAALFAVHPLQLESVAWISSRKGLISATFLLMSLQYWFRPDRTARDEAFGLLFYAISLLAKALGIVLPAMVLVYDIFVRKMKFGEAFSRQIIPGMLAVWLLLVTMGAQTTEVGGVREHLEWSKARIVAVDSVILWQYVSMLAAPSDLCVLYDPQTEGIGIAVALSMCAWGLVLAFVWRRRTSNPLLLVALFSFFALLFPVLNFFPITTLMNDRYLYLPSVALFATAAAFVEWLFVKVRPSSNEEMDRSVRWRQVPWGQVCAYSLAAAVVAQNAVAAHRHLPVWRNSTSLWENAFEQNPQIPVVRIQWAYALHDAGREAEAIAMLEETLVKTKPDEADRKRILRKLDEWGRDHASNPGGARL
ncbi:MAG: hypothetical protein AB7O26_14335 [Planctomycetaceae bacterium]